MIYYGLMMQVHRALAAAVLACLASTAPAQTPPAPQDAASGTPVAAAPSSPMTARLMYELLLGELLLRQGDAQDGGALLLNAARRTGDEALFRRAAEMAIQSRSGPLAIESTRAWRQAYPDSPAAAQYELQVLVVLGRAAETEEPVRHFLATLPESERLSFITALPALYQRVPDKAETARVIERALTGAINDPALAPAAWTSIGRLRLQAGDQAGALAAATLGQNASAQSEWPALLALQLMAGGETQAEALIQRHLATAQARPELHVSYIRELAEQGQMAAALRELGTLIARAPEHPDGWLLRAALYVDARRDADAEADLRHYLALLDRATPPPGAERPEGRDRARLMLARIAERRGDFADAEQWLAAVESPDQALAVQTGRAQMLARQGRLDAAREAIRATPEREADDARLKVLAEAQLLRDQRQYEPAYRLLTDELDKNPEDETLLYEAALAADRAGQPEAMERLLRRLIELKPDAAHAHNALGYSLADRNLRLPEARALIEKAVQLSPDDAYIQDSLGWVHFRQGNLRQARRILDAAFKRRPDAEIAAHLGEVMWVQGEQDGARRMWREGLRLDADNETLGKTLRRFRVKP